MALPPVARNRPRAPRRTALVLAVCALTAPVLVGRPAAAQEEGGGTEAPAQLALKTFSDNDGLFKIQLPTEWKLMKDMNLPNKLGAWSGPMLPHDENATALLAVQVNPNFRRALLAASQPRDKVLEKETRSGPGFQEVCVQPASSNIKLIWYRHVEAHGQLYTVMVQTVHDDVELARPVVRKWFDTFELVKAPEPATPPEGWSTKTSKGIEVWSDSDDKKEIARAVELVTTAADMLKKVLPGKPFDASPLRLRFFADAGEFNEVSGKTFNQEVDIAAFGFNENAIYVKGLTAGNSNYEQSVYYAGADATVRRHFGGIIPEWLRIGLVHYAQYAALSGGKPKKLDGQYIDSVRPAAQTARQLDTWFDLDFSRSGDTQKSAREVFAWVWFLNHGKVSKTASKAFENYLKTLHRTGDEKEARKAWADVDFPALHQELKDFAPEWK